MHDALRRESRRGAACNDTSLAVLVADDLRQLVALSTFEDYVVIFGDSDALLRDFTLTLPYLVPTVVVIRTLLVCLNAAMLPPRVQRRFHFDLDAALVSVLASRVVQ